MDYFKVTGSCSGNSMDARTQLSTKLWHLCGKMGWNDHLRSLILMDVPTQNGGRTSEHFPAHFVCWDVDLECRFSCNRTKSSSVRLDHSRTGPTGFSLARLVPTTSSSASCTTTSASKMSSATSVSRNGIRSSCHTAVASVYVNQVVLIPSQTTCDAVHEASLPFEPNTFSLTNKWHRLRRHFDNCHCKHSISTIYF